jgi:HK97 family phage portal protein
MANPTIWQRARAAFNVFRHGYPQTKEMPFAWPSYRSGVPQWHMYDYDTFVAEGWTINSLIYSAIMFKARALASAPLKAWTGDKEHKEPLPPDDDLSRLIARPNTHQSDIEFQQQATVYLNISGNNFTMLDRPRRGAPVEQMVNLRPDRVLIVPDPKKRKAILGYVYVPEGATQANGIPILTEDMMHVKFPNPADPLEGMGYGFPPLAPLARNADVDNAVTGWLKRLFDRGLMPNMMIKYNVPLTRDLVNRAHARYAEAYGGSEEGWLRPVVLGSEGEMKRLGYSFDELGFDGIDARNETRILAPFGVPPILIGSRVGLAHGTYSNYEQARAAFWQDTFVPELRLFETEYQYYLNEPGRDAWISFDLSDVPALKQALVELITAAKELWAMGVPANQAVQTVGIQMSDIPGGDIGYLPLNLVPTGSSVIARGEEQADVTATDDDREEAARIGPARTKQRHLTLEQKDILWKQMDQIARSWESKYQDAAREALRRDERAVLAIVNEAKQKALERKQSINWTQIALDWDAYWRDGAPKNWREAFFAVIRGTMTDTAEELNAEFGFTFDVENIAAREWFAEYVLVFSQEPIQTTADNLKLIIDQGIENGWTIDELRKQIGANFDRYLIEGFEPNLSEQELQWFIDRRPAYRRENIARTETLHATNAGAFETYKAWGVVDLKEWLDSRDNRVRPTHTAAGAQYGLGGNPGPIPIDDPFIIGGQPMMYPLDGSLGASASEICQCRCSVSPVITEGLE